MQRTQIGGAESSMESMSMGDYLSTVTALGEQWRAPALESLLPDLSRDERLRLQAALRHRQRAYKGSPPPRPLLSERERDSYILIHAHYAIQYYNASHPGDEFHVVKPLMVSSSGRLSTGDAWFHVNFWARSRSSSKIKRFFAEVHNKPSTSEFIKIGPMQIPAPIPVVEVCTILEEPLCQYKTTCALCSSDRDILHPKGCLKFVRGRDKHVRAVQLPTMRCCTGLKLRPPFSGRPDSEPSSSRQ